MYIFLSFNYLWLSPYSKGLGFDSSRILSDFMIFMIYLLIIIHYFHFFFLAIKYFFFKSKHIKNIKYNYYKYIYIIFYLDLWIISLRQIDKTIFQNIFLYFIFIALY